MSSTTPTTHYEKNRATGTWYLTDPRLREEFFTTQNSLPNIPSQSSSGRLPLLPSPQIDPALLEYDQKLATNTIIQVTELSDKKVSTSLEQSISLVGKHLTEEPEEQEVQEKDEGSKEQTSESNEISSQDMEDRDDDRVAARLEKMDVDVDEEEEKPQGAHSEETLVQQGEEDEASAAAVTVPTTRRRTRSQYNSQTGGGGSYQTAKTIVEKQEIFSQPSSTTALKGRDIVFVDPRDKNEKFWWPAMIVPHEEADESMGFDELAPNEVIVKYFEDCTYSAVPKKEIRRFHPQMEPFLKYAKKYGAEFTEHIGVVNACRCLTAGEPEKEFKWDYWMRPADTQNESSNRVTTDGFSNSAVPIRKSTRSRKGKEKDDIYETELIKPRRRVAATPRRQQHDMEEVTLQKPTRSRKMSLRKHSHHSVASPEAGGNVEDEGVIDIEGVSPADSEYITHETTTNSKIKKSTRKRSHEVLSDRSDTGGMAHSSTTTVARTVTKGKRKTKKHRTNLPDAQDSENIATKNEKAKTKIKKPRSSPTPEPILGYEELPEERKRNVDRFNFEGLSTQEKTQLYQEAERHLRQLALEYRRVLANVEELNKKIKKRRLEKRLARKAEQKRVRKLERMADRDHHGVDEIITTASHVSEEQSEA